jgi:hypothetical protein
MWFGWRLPAPQPEIALRSYPGAAAASSTSEAAPQTSEHVWRCAASLEPVLALPALRAGVDALTGEIGAQKLDSFARIPTGQDV